MRTSFAFLALSVACLQPLAHAAQEAPAKAIEQKAPEIQVASPKSDADKAADALKALKGQTETEAFAQLAKKEQLLKGDSIYRELAVQSRRFFTSYPTDDRRWGFVVESAYLRPSFIKGFKPEFDASPSRANIITDEAAAEAFKKEQTAILEGIYAAKGVNSHVKVGGAGWLIMEAEAQAMATPSSENRALLKKRVDALITVLPDDAPDSLVAAGPETLLRVLKAQAPEELEAYKTELRKSSNPVLAELPDAEAKQIARLADLGTIKFTAVDGREVDVAKLKGHVVLIDFWATWCGPCKEELPNVKAVYQKLHDKGFEVVSISLDDAKSKQKLVDFVAANGIPWPQMFDGKGWETELAVKYGVKAIPAMFLLDKEGKLASLEARGPELEKQVSKLLGL
jgi:thiol-disulfide isomerase/thioredoxin